MRLFALCVLALASALSSAERILLIPLDSRPAAGQFAQMIAAISGTEVVTPPLEILGRFTTPGSPEKVLRWIEGQDLSDVMAVVASIDTVAYGGLVQSRVNETSAAVAISRIDRMAKAVRKSPRTKLYVFSAIMRLAPTATNQARPWRMNLASYYEARDKWIQTGDVAAKRKMQSLASVVPAKERQKYEATRKRNHEVQRSLIHRASRRQFDFLVLGQDDAKQYGPFVSETASLRKLADSLYAGGMVFFCEGIDQHAAILVSRAMLKDSEWAPKVRVEFSDDAGRKKYASYESKPIEASLRDQILASGARIAPEFGDCDYTLYLNTPKPRKEPFEAWLKHLLADVDSGKPVAVADINLGNDGTGDPMLWAWIRDRSRMMRLASYAAWNTAGNTMGTAIPAANIYMFALKNGYDPLKREIAQKEFLLHRLVNDYAYHRFSRPIAFQLIDSDPKVTREEAHGLTFHEINDFVRRDLGKHLQRTFEQQFRGKRFSVGEQEYQMTELSDVKVLLPWPRAYEVQLSFRMHAEPIATTAGQPVPAPGG